MFYGNEHRYLEGWQKYGVQASINAGGAGTRASVRIDNPKGSKIVAVIEKITFQPQGTADAPQITYSIISAGDQAQTVITVSTGLDQRGPQSPNLHVTAQAIVQSIVGVTIYQANMGVGTPPVVDVILLESHELPLLPNSSYTVYSNTLNLGLALSLWWRERPQEDSELT
jgi:hypothetical protein